MMPLWQPQNARVSAPIDQHDRKSLDNKTIEIRPVPWHAYCSIGKAEAK